MQIGKLANWQIGKLAKSNRLCVSELTLINTLLFTIHGLCHDLNQPINYLIMFEYGGH